MARAWALGWEARPRAQISNPTNGRPDFHFRAAETGFFVKQLQGTDFNIELNHRAVIGDHLRTTYDMPYARVSFLRIHAASCGVPPNPLETDRI